MATFVSINPALMDGAFVAFADLENADELKPVPLPAGASPFTNLRVFQSDMSASVAASLGIGSLFSTSGGSSSVAIIYEAMLYTETYANVPLGGLIQGTRWGAGLRLALNVRDVTAKGALSIGVVAANAQLNNSQASFELTGIGISDPGILSALPDPGQFDIDTYHQILDAVAKVKAYMAANTAKLVAAPFAVSLVKPISIDIIDRSYSVVYSMRKLIKRSKLADALSQAPTDVDVNLVRDVYSDFAGISNENADPTTDVSSKAQAWLNAAT